MTESASSLSSWENFYVVVGSSGGTLIGLQLVVITLIAGSPLRTSTVALVPLSVAVGTCGLGGLAYGAVVLRRTRRQTDYAPAWEYWL